MVNSLLMCIDMWYRNSIAEVDKLDVFFYPNAGEYRGNLYKAGKMIGDYVTNDSLELEKSFPQIVFNWN